MEHSRILIVDDEPEMLDNLDYLLTAAGHRCWKLADPLRFRELRAEVRPHVVISDVKMPGADGMTILAAAMADDPILPVILITGYGSIASAVEAIQQGAFDYLEKPFSSKQLSITVERALRHRSLLEENRSLRRQIKEGLEMDLVGSSEPFLDLLDQVRRVADTAANVLVTGESGTGKELIARSIHRQSTRRGGPFVPVDCAALPDGLLESEVFGHTKGAFTGAVTSQKGLLVTAHGGTVFLDEIGELAPPLQAKLLRVIEERQVRPVGSPALVDVDIRIVAATNVDLEAAVAEGAFREDLFYRLNVVWLRIPPLRDRPGDVVLLAERFLTELAEKSGKDRLSIPDGVWRRLEAYHWPGNVRQLRNAVERMVALADGGPITASSLPPEILSALPKGMEFTKGLSEPSTVRYSEARGEALLAFRAWYLQRLIDACGGNISRAAQVAGVNRRTVYRWLTELEGVDRV
jgi:two-component system response regulator HydG